MTLLSRSEFRDLLDYYFDEDYDVMTASNVLASDRRIRFDRIARLHLPAQTRSLKNSRWRINRWRRNATWSIRRSKVFYFEWSEKWWNKILFVRMVSRITAMSCAFAVMSVHDYAIASNAHYHGRHFLTPFTLVKRFHLVSISEPLTVLNTAPGIVMAKIMRV